MLDKLNITDIALFAIGFFPLVWYLRRTYRHYDTPSSGTGLSVQWNAFCCFACVWPFSALWLSCIINLRHNTAAVLYTDCGGAELVPSISACIGSITRPIWSTNVVCYIWQRLFSGPLLYIRYTTGVTGQAINAPILNKARLALHTGEQVSLVMLSVVSSTDWLFVHEVSFGCFAVCCCLNLLTTCRLCQLWARGATSSEERAEAAAAFRTRVALASFNLCSLVLAIFFFWLHESPGGCGNYTYSRFTICEWLFVATNILWHYEGEMRELRGVHAGWTMMKDRCKSDAER